MKKVTITKRPKNLVMKFDPKTIKHLGGQMYSQLPPVIAEIIANSYDADAEKVEIFLNDKNKKEIIIKDSGHGMSFDEINDKFLIIGRNRREGDNNFSPIKKRAVIGKKGLGKLSFFGVANLITVETVNDNLLNKFVLDLKRLEKTKGDYNPEIINKNKKTNSKNGTTITLSELKRKTIFQPKEIAKSLARYFSILDESDFSVLITHNNDKKNRIKISTDLLYEDIGIRFEWKFPMKHYDDIDYEYSRQIHGKAISAFKTVPPSMRGIALFSRGKLVNEYSFYDDKATSHGYSYITGRLDVSFIDKWDKDVISTNRRSLNWEDEDTNKLKDFLIYIVKHVYNEHRKRVQEEKKTEVEKITGIKLDRWIGNLPKHERKLASKMVSTILQSEEIETEKAGEMVRYVKDSFQFESFKEFASDIDKIPELNSESFLKMLKEWNLIEAREFYKLSIGRIETIKKFEKYIKDKVKEVPTMHNFLKSFPWLLDPRIIEFKDEVHYSNLLKEKYTDDDEKIDSDRRIDFLCTSIANNFFVIELKKPGHKIRKKDIDQASDYRSFVES